jgi:hypothetical protein
MVPFDIIDAAANAYRVTWRERGYFMRLAALPVAVKFLTFIAIILLEIENNLLRQSLLMLPANLIEGFLLACLVRFVFFEQRFPFDPSSLAMRGIKSGAVMYALIKFLMAGILSAATGNDVLQEIERSTEEPTTQEVISALVMLALTIYGFRFLWLYILLAVNVRTADIVRLLKGISLSLYMIGAWVLCFLPLFMVLAGVSGTLMGGYLDGEMPLSAKIALMGTQAVFDTVIAILTTASIAFGFREMVGIGDKKNGQGKNRGGGRNGP